MKFEKLTLFSTSKELVIFLTICFSLFSINLLLEYKNYKEITKFDTALIKATLIKQYTKHKNNKSYQVLKFKSDNGFTFYTTTKKPLKNITFKLITLELHTDKITFYSYLTHSFGYSKIINIDKSTSTRQEVNKLIDNTHKDNNISSIYKALYLATPLPPHQIQYFSALGISHLFAISGFHLGLLSGLLFFILKFPYSFLQDRYFPYRNSKIDIFVIASTLLFTYMYFLDFPPSLLRAYVMLVVGYLLYERYYEVISMQTLFVSVLILISFEPRLLFSIGFFLSVCGVFYIFLFFIHFKHLSRFWQFTLLPIWMYLMMIIYSVVIFKNYSIYYPLSIIISSLFSIFYPLSIILHFIGYGDLLDSILKKLLEIDIKTMQINLSIYFLYFYIFISLISLKKRFFIWLLLCYTLFFQIVLIKYVT